MDFWQQSLAGCGTSSLSLGCKFIKRRQGDNSMCVQGTNSPCAASTRKSPLVDYRTEDCRSAASLSATAAAVRCSVLCSTLCSSGRSIQSCGYGRWVGVVGLTTEQSTCARVCHVTHPLYGNRHVDTHNYTQ